MPALEKQEPRTERKARTTNGTLFVCNCKPDAREVFLVGQFFDLHGGNRAGTDTRLRPRGPDHGRWVTALATLSGLCRGNEGKNDHQTYCRNDLRTSHVNLLFFSHERF